MGKKRINIVIVASILVALAIGVACMGNLGQDATQTSFRTDSERIKEIQQYFPVTVPSTATQITLKTQKFQDYHMMASFTLPPQDYANFKNAWKTFAAKFPSQGNDPIEYITARCAGATFDDAKCRVDITGFSL